VTESLQALILRQVRADERRGFPLVFRTDKELLDQVSRDLIGLFGEIGELANIVKKITISHGRDDYPKHSLVSSRERLGEELADVTIYLLRLSVLLQVDLPDAISRKMDLNDERYSGLEKDE
jgi:NTP pyrophosphatase (non-canonical NTP hydrolase)